MSIVIREARAADRPALVALWVEAWTTAMPAIDFAARREWLIAQLDALEAAGAVVLVAGLDNGEPLGFVTIDPVRQAMDQLAVARSAQRQGLGRQLIDAAKRRAPAGIGLSVNAANRRAIALYEREGFAIFAEGTNERSGLAILHMRWEPEGGGAAHRADGIDGSGLTPATAPCRSHPH